MHFDIHQFEFSAFSKLYNSKYYFSLSIQFFLSTSFFFFNFKITFVLFFFTNKTLMSSKQSVTGNPRFITYPKRRLYLFARCEIPCELSLFTNQSLVLYGICYHYLMFDAFELAKINFINNSVNIRAVQLFKIYRITTNIKCYCCLCKPCELYFSVPPVFCRTEHCYICPFYELN